MLTDLKPIYLLSGTDRPKVQRAVDRLKGHFDRASIETLSAHETTGEAAMAVCNALGLFAAEGRLVLVGDVERWKLPDVKAIGSYLAGPAPGTVLALVATDLKKDSPLAKECARSGAVLVYDVQKRDLARWIAEQFARMDAKAHPDACRALVDLVGDSVDELGQEVEKLALWAGDAEIAVDDVERLVAGRQEVAPWSLTDGWGRRDIAGVLAASEQLLSGGERSKTPSALVWQMADHVALVRACRAFAAAGVSPSEAAKRLKRRSDFPVRKAYAHAERYDDIELRAAIVKLADLDVAVKGGSRLPDELELERGLIEITRGQTAMRRR